MNSKRNTASLIVLASYPRRHSVHGEGTVGIASYTKNTLLSLVKATKSVKRKIGIIVLAEKLSDKTDTYAENDITVSRCWERGSLFVFFQLLKQILTIRNCQTVLIEFEVSMFGGFWTLAIFPFLLLFLKLFGKEIIIVTHQIIEDINDLSGHIDLEKESIQADIINIVVRWFYRIAFLFVSRVIVFEDAFKHYLSRFIPPGKIVVIPHGVEKVRNFPTRANARKMLGIHNEFVILVFGFIAWYKGTDWIVDYIRNLAIKNQKKRIKLIIAGGENPNHKDKAFYQEYVQKIQNIAQQSNGHIVITGFVEEKKISTYFQSCDLVVLPYRTFMSSSGPLAFAFSFHKPVLFSEALYPYMSSSDFKQAMGSANIAKNELFFSLQDNSLGFLLRKLTGKTMKKHIRFSQEMVQKRSFEDIGKSYVDALFG